MKHCDICGSSDHKTERHPAIFIDPHDGPDTIGEDPWAKEKAWKAARKADRRLPVRMADAAQYEREAIPAEQRGQIRVRLLNATPDPLGSIAALGKQYKGEVVRNLSEVTDEERRSYLDDFGKTVLNGPLEAAQFHFQIEGVTRSITHQMVRTRASFFAQESLRFAVPEGNWADEIPLPPWLSGAREARAEYQEEIRRNHRAQPSKLLVAFDSWEDGMISAQNTYTRLIDLGMPAEEARGVLPHDMPTRIHMVCDLRTLLADAGKRTCTQAQFPWRVIFAGIAKALREYQAPTYADVVERYGKAECDSTTGAEYQKMLSSLWRPDHWQFVAIADRLRPVCFQTGQCGFMAQFDRSCKIRSRVDAFATAGVAPKYWNTARNEDGLIEDADGAPFQPINNAEWAADPGAARS